MDTWTVTRALRRRSLRGGAAALLLTAALSGTGPASAAAPAAPKGRPATAGSSPVVTLITGDQVRLIEQPGGQLAVGIEPAAGREHVGFLRESSAGHVSVVPADAAPLLAAGRLDPRLFDVTELARQGFTDAASPALPLIVTGTAPAAAPPAPAAAARTVGALPSIRGTVVREDRQHGSAFWTWLEAAGGVGMVWLDGFAHPLDDGSAAQIGAPTAWQAGVTGAGVTVGVLDTGIDAAHPDLAGKVVAAKDFTGTRPDAGDDIGHGTHVAGIIAGTGAASNGTERGIAPDARLISGKVCTAIGCPDSAVIAGMEWIAPQARVVNVSLGGASTDGSDPVSQAVDSLSAQFGTLFVAAAGDANDPVASVAAPAAADAALAVGSVDRQDQTSSFSTRGPRLGDHAPKPDIAAPGDGIVSARAAGTPDGDLDPVDANYAILSGTSIATPHVSGAAADLLQQHPDWSAAQLKAALMSTAKPTAGVFEQGAGRVDLGRAVTQTVTATGGSLSYGFFRWPHRDPARRSVTYRNDGAQAVTLTLSVTAGGPNGQAAPAGLFTTSAPQVTVPAHGTAAVDVVMKPAVGGAGLFGGRVTASGAGVGVQTAFDAFLEPESYDLTVRLIGRPGLVDSVLGQAIDTATGAAFGLRPFAADGTTVIRLPKGRYDVDLIDAGADPATPNQPSAITVLSKPEVALGADTGVTLDASAGRPVRAVVDRPDAALQFGELGIQSTDAAGDRGSSISWFASAGQRLFAVPSGAAVADHQLNFFFRATLAPVPPDTDPSAFVYQLAFFERGRIPADTVYVVHNRDLATVDARYFGQGGPAEAVRADFAQLPLPTTGAAVFQVFRHTVPSRRTEYYTARPDVTWLQQLGITDASESDAEVIISTRSYPVGRTQVTWNRAPLGPAFGDVSEGFGVSRVGNLLSVAVTLLSGNDPHQYTVPPFAMTGDTTLSRDGTVLGDSPAPGFGAFPIPDSPGTYTLHATGSRAVPWSVIGSGVDVTWTFPEPGAAAPAAPLPLLVVRAGGDVDEQGRAAAGEPFVLSLLVQRQPGATVSGRITALRVEASYDDGATWTAAPTTLEGNGGHAILHHPAGPGFASLRITARDAAGSSVTQTVIRAYQIVPEH
ncbi:MAG TPA: S8 family serine peptidase [Candidatus Dormibacteraeota bacterium]|nr:S8 family serine peptidase [Candidatus Dormibacteraeota bacterium]